ncbi:hypothetical protein FRC01_010460 [Tulasnella sp. 417]|nr:hypothetical protein FRC01_010460 [Tulasnella sp. 417]
MSSWRMLPLLAAAPQQSRTTRLLETPPRQQAHFLQNPTHRKSGTKYLKVSNSHSGFTTDEELIEMELDKYLTPYGQLAPDIFSGMHSSNPLLQLESVTKAAELLRSKNLSADVTVQAVVDSGLLPNAIDMLSSSNSDLVLEASSILLDITLGTSEQTSAAVSAGAIPKLVAASASEVEDVAYSALLALGNIAADSDELRDVFLEQGAFRPALRILAGPAEYSAKIVSTAAWIMESCAASDMMMEYDSIPTLSEVIPILCKFIRQKNKPKPLTAVIKALHQMSSSQRAATMILKHGAVPCLVRFCTSKNDGLRQQALKLVAWLAYEEGKLLKSMIYNGILKALEICITDYVQSRRLACLVASNIAIAAPLQAEALVESSVLPLLTGIVADQKEEWKIRNEALTILFHLARKGLKNDRFFSSLIEADCFEACCAALGCTDWGTIQTGAEIIRLLVDTSWSGADDAIQRLEDAGGVNLLRKVWLEGRSKNWPQPPSVTAHILLRTYFPESSKPPRV